MPRTIISRRQLLKLSAMATGAATLANCGPAGTTPASTSAPVQALSGEIQYCHYDFGPANASREAARDTFQKMHPGTKINLTMLPYGEMYEKVAAGMATGQPPDVIYGDFGLVRYALEGQLLDLTDRVQADSVLSQADLFTMSLTDPLQAKYGTSKLFALAQGTWVPIFYFNRELFDAAGVAYPNEDWTWDDVSEAAKALTKPEADQYGVQFGTTLDNVGWLWWMNKPADFWATPQAFPDKTHFASDAGRAALALFRRFGADEKTHVPVDVNATFDVYGGAFGAGKVGMYSGGDWDAGWSFKDLPFQWGMTMLPMAIKGYRPKLNTMVSTNVIAKATKNPDLAWEWIRFLTATPEGQTLIGEGAFEAPVLKEAASSDAVLKPSWAAPGYEARHKAAELPGPMYTPYPLNLDLWEFPGQHIDPTVEQLKSGEITVEDAVAYLDAEGNPYFAKQKQDTPPIP